MSMMNNFDKDFVSRTIIILEDLYNNTEYEVTLLLNCLLALITLPSERTKLEDGSIIEDYKRICIEKLNELINTWQKTKFDKDDIKMYKHVRDAIAHLYIEVEEGGYVGEIHNIILRNAKDKKHYDKGEFNFEINISVNNLKAYAIYIAKEYLKILE